MIRLDIPLEENALRKLKVGDEVELFGSVVTSRDAGHKLMVEKKPDFIRPHIENGVIYHCGPVMTQKKGRWIAAAAGPTTSIREEPYEATVIEDYKVRGIIGKGGMGKRTADALKRFGAVYLHAVGGAAVAIADSIKEIETVYMLDEFGVPEAFWVMRVEGFKAIVTMDTRGRSLHDRILKASKKVRDALIG
jgi:fumarate hydratase subunit beta